MKHGKEGKGRGTERPGLLSYLGVGFLKVRFESPSPLEALHNGHSDPLAVAGSLMSAVWTAAVGRCCGGLDEAGEARCSLSINEWNQMSGGRGVVLNPAATTRQG